MTAAASVVARKSSERLAADSPEPPHIAKRRDADEQARHHQRHDDHGDAGE